jgi:hypothetical protein
MVISIHNFTSSSGSGTVINYGSGSDFLTSYGSGSGSTSQKVTVPTVPVPVPQHCFHAPGSGSGSTFPRGIRIQDSQINVYPGPQHWFADIKIR